MSSSTIFMLVLGILAGIAGLVVLLKRGGSERAVYGRRIGGAMGLALGLALIVFAIGLGA